MSLVTRSMNMNIPVDGSMIPGLSPAKFAEYQKHAENLIRHGGELRWKAGSPGGRGGEIFALVRDAGSGGQQVMSQASKLAMNLSGIGAVASVANLAVSAVGFYVLNDKVNKLQDEMDRLHEAVSAGFEQMEQRFVQVQYLLEGLAEGQSILKEGQEHIQDQNEAASFAPVMTVLQRLEECRQKDETPSDERAGRWLDKSRDARNTFAYVIDKWCTGQKSVETVGFARGTGYYQLWASALIAEARLLRMIGRTEEASDMIYGALEDWYYPRIQKTAGLLFNFEPGLLLAGPFEGRVRTGHYLDLRELEKGDRGDAVERERWVSEADDAQSQYFGRSPQERLDKMRSMDSRSKYSRAAQVYSLLETGRRLNTLALEYEMCAREGLSVEEWEDVHANDDTDDIRLIPAA